MHSDQSMPGNWGRWGPDDERGAANHLTPESVAAAAALVKDGIVHQLGREIGRGASLAHPGRPPALHFMTLDGGDFAAGARLPGGAEYAEDMIMLHCHGTTHVDALAHYWSDGRLYNDHAADRVRSYGATRCGIEQVGAVVTRGVLLDMTDRGELDADHVISADDLAAHAADAGVEVRAGDVVLIRTGWPAVFEADPERYHSANPGIGLEAATWLAERDVVAVGADTIGVEVRTGPDRYEGGAAAPVVHPLLIRDYGIHLIELLDLDDLAAAEATEFLFVMSPLRIVGGTGSPVNPIGIT